MYVLVLDYTCGWHATIYMDINMDPVVMEYLAIYESTLFLCCVQKGSS